MKVLQPPGWAAPRGYVNGVAASGTQVFVAGQIGWNGQCVWVSDDLVAQVRQALMNVRAVLAEAGATPAHICRMTWYLTDKREYLARAREIGVALPRGDRQLHRGHVGGAGGGTGGRPRQGGDRGHGRGALNRDQRQVRCVMGRSAPGAATRPGAATGCAVGLLP
jgi:enamine deaminase RidA (YjgF/YER057c/UK114 family)